MRSIKIQKAMVMWLRNAIVETDVFCECEIVDDIINKTVDVAFHFEGYSLRFNDWELNRMYEYLKENPNKTEIEGARDFLKQGLKNMINERGL